MAGARCYVYAPNHLAPVKSDVLERYLREEVDVLYEGVKATHSRADLWIAHPLIMAGDIIYNLRLQAGRMRLRLLEREADRGFVKRMAKSNMAPKLKRADLSMAELFK